MEKNKQNLTKRLVTFSMFSAIVILLTFTPIGFVNLGFIKATVVHIPVIIGAIILGPKMGAGLGFVFGATSLISNTFSPVVSSFAFSPFMPAPGTAGGSPWALAVCFIPRICVGIIPWYAYRLAQRLTKKTLNLASLAIAGMSGAITNTILVMHLIYFFFRDAYAQARGVALNAVYGVITTIIVSNGIPEAIIAGILTVCICKSLFIVLKTEHTNVL